jgi:ABC-2 type transport system ATP-binding protein
MLFSEEMTVLSERFREMPVTLAAPGPLPRELPAAWLQAETADCVARFVHSEYRGEASEHEALAVFAGARDVEAEPMPLRAIFLALAKSGRAHGGTAHKAEQGTAAGGRVQA